jgi:hypothetical protein
MPRGTVLRKRIAVAITVGLLLIVAATFLTGFVAAALDLNRFAYHKYAAYVAIVLALVHVCLHWRGLSGQVRRWFLRASPPVAPCAPAHPTAGAGSRLRRRTLLWPGLSMAAGPGAAAKRAIGRAAVRAGHGPPTIRA